MTACSADLDQSPPNFASADSLTDFEGVFESGRGWERGVGRARVCDDDATDAK